MDSYRFIHEWVQAALKGLGVQTHFYKSDFKGVNYGNQWCFKSAVCNDLIANGEKIVGGAQWRDGLTAMHQGSIQLELSESQLGPFKNAFFSSLKKGFKPHGPSIPCS